MNKLKLLFLAAMFSCIYSQGQKVIHSEILSCPTDNSITVSAIFDSNVDCRVAYGTVSGNYTNQTQWQPVIANSQGEAFAVVLIENLNSNTKYYYQLQYRKPAASNYLTQPEHSFRTARPKGESFTFVIQADPHLDAASDTSLYRLCLKNQADDNPDFMIDLGDFLMTDKLKNANNIIPEDTIPYRCKLLRSYYESVNHSIPLYIAIGNHEGEAGWYNDGTANNIAVWNTNYRKQYFQNPLPDKFYSGDTTHYKYTGQRGAYYAWEWGDALFVVLDPYWFTSPKPDSLHGWRWTLGRQQYSWLKATLENSNAKFKLVFAHQLDGGDKDGRGGIERAPFYEWGGKNIDGTYGWQSNRPGWDKPIKDLLKDNRVTIFFHGHDHLFAKQDMDCMVYQEVPQPSLPNYRNVPQAIDYGYLSGTIIPNAGHLRVKVSPEGVTVDYVRAYIPSSESASRHNRDVSLTYSIGAVNCYDSLQSSVPVIWNDNYMNETIFPNPSENSVTIRINALVPVRKLSVSIYDITGKLIKTIISSRQIDKGNYSVNWDGRNSSGEQLPDGLYICRIIQDNNITNHRIVLSR